MATMNEYKERMKGCVGNVDSLNALNKDIEKDSDLSPADKKKLHKATATHIKIANGQSITTHDQIIQGKDLKATTKELDYTDTVGMLCFYSVSESGEHCAVPNDVIADYFNDNDMAQVEKPKPHREKDAFKKACADFSGTKPITPAIKKHFPNADRIIWTVDQLNAHEYVVTRKIIALMDSDKKSDEMEHHTLDHDKICKILLDETKTTVEKKSGETKEQSTLRYRVIPEKKAYQSMTDEIRETLLERVEFYQTHTTGKKIRDGIRDMIRRHNGINFTGSTGGTWFIPIHADEVVANYKDFIAWVDDNHTHGFGKARMITIPLIDDVDIKQQISDDVKRELAHRMNKLLEKTLKQLEFTEQGEIEALLERKLAEHNNGKDMLDEYRTLLKEKINVRINSPLPDNITAKGGKALSGRQTAMLQRLTWLGDDE